MTSSNKKVPIDFLGIGAPRCGTTWLAACLNEHPQLCISKVKERGVFKEDGTLYKKEIFDKNFSSCKNDTLRGTFPVNYLYRKEFAKYLGKHSPNLKIIVMLRNPVDRLHSHLLLKQSVGKIKQGLSLDKIYNQKHPHSFVKASNYSKYLPVWLSEFPSTQVFIGIQEEMMKNPTVVLKDIYNFLGVDDSFRAPSANKTINATMEKRRKMKSVTYVITQLKTLKQKIEKYSFGKVIIFIWRKLKLPYLIERLEKKNRIILLARKNKQEKPQISNQIRSKFEKIFEKDISYVEKVIGRKLKEWRIGV